jgi:hypothetical protein
VKGACDHIRNLNDRTLGLVIIRASLDLSHSDSPINRQLSIEFGLDGHNLPCFTFLSIYEKRLSPNKKIRTLEHQLRDLSLDSFISSSALDVRLRPQTFVKDTTMRRQWHAFEFVEERLPNL